MTTDKASQDAHFMTTALNLAQRGLGQVWPNPAVGCVIARNGAVIGRGWTQPGGRPHAETEALIRAGAEARGATAYVTLEPCAHHGQTPPCAQALVDAKIARCVIATEDPDPRVSGQGIAALRDAGIDVEVGLAEAEARQINAGFFSRLERGRPLVTVKLATTLDGRIATRAGESQWITGEQARRAVHRLRAEHDAIAVGSGTVLADNPSLDCRLPGLRRLSPIRVVFDGRLRLPLAAELVHTANVSESWVYTLASSSARERREALEQAGVKVLDGAADEESNLDLAAALADMAKRGITRLLVEGGGHLVAALFRAGLVDRLVWMHAPKLFGGDGLPAVMGFGVNLLAEAPALTPVNSICLGDDRMQVFKVGGGNA